MKYRELQEKYQITYGVLKYTLKKYNVYKKRNNYKGKRKVKCLNTNIIFDSIKSARD